MRVELDLPDDDESLITKDAIALAGSCAAFGNKNKISLPVLGDLWCTTVVVLNDDKFPEGLDLDSLAKGVDSCGGLQQMPRSGSGGSGLKKVMGAERQYSLHEQTLMIWHFLKYTHRTTVGSNMWKALACKMWPGISFIFSQLLMIALLDLAILHHNVPILAAVSCLVVINNMIGKRAEKLFRSFRLPAAVMLQLRNNLVQILMKD